MTDAAERIRRAAQTSLDHGWIAGEQVADVEGTKLTVSFVIDVARRATAQTIGLYIGTPNAFWTRSVSEGAFTYLPVTPDGDDPNPNARWIKEDASRFPNQPPVMPLFWLRGAVEASPVGVGFAVVVSREAGVAVAPEEDRSAMSPTWSIFGPAHDFDRLPEAPASVALDDAARIRAFAMDTAGGGHRVEYRYLDEAPAIFVPANATHIDDLPDDWPA